MIPYTKHEVSEDDIRAVVEVLRGERLTQGTITAAFERALADYLGADPANVIACNNGTAALTLAYVSAGVGRGWTVYVPAITFAATASAAMHLGARVVLVDVDPVTGLATPEAFADAVGDAVNADKRLRGAPFAWAPVHLRGEPCNVGGMVRARRALGGFAIIEDACHALGAGGTGFGDVRAYSFHPAKHITTGEGGAVVLGEGSLSWVRMLKDHGRNSEGEVERPGYNHRLADLNAALGLSQLERASAYLERRRNLAARYDDLLTIPRVPWTWDSAMHLCCVRVPRGQVESLQAHLASRGVGTQRHYKPLQWHRAFTSCQVGPLPGAKAYYETTLTLPLFPSMTEEEQDRVIDAVNEWRSE